MDGGQCRRRTASPSKASSCPVSPSKPRHGPRPAGESEYANTVNGGPSPSSALTTDLNLLAEILWRIYHGRADCENPIKARKYDFAADSFTMKTFWATEATLNPVMPAFNLISLLQQVLLKTQIGRPASSEGQASVEDLAVQPICQSSKYPHRAQKIDLESDQGYATSSMQARPLRCRKLLRMAR